MRAALRRATAVGLIALTGAIAACSALPPAPTAELAPSGRLRAAINFGNPILAVKNAEVDIAFVAIDPVRGADMLQTLPYVIIEGAYLVRTDSPIRRNEDVDRAEPRHPGLDPGFISSAPYPIHFRALRQICIHGLNALLSELVHDI